MLARRVIAISSDKAIAKRLALGLRAAGGTVETYESPDSLPKGEIQAALVVAYIDADLAGDVAGLVGRLEKDARLIAVLPKSNLVDLVATMQGHPRVAGTLIADELTTDAVSSMAYRVLYGDIFGLEKVVPWGTRVYSMLVGDYQEKSICIAQISEFAKLMGVRRKYRESIEQCLDEMLMNALYDAPVDSDGNQMFADVPTKTRISLRMEQKAVVQYACDGETFTVSVRDSFGTLDRDTVLRYLHKCLHSEQQIDRKTGGAGLGLYIMANTTTVFLFNSLPGVATEVITTFDLTAPKVQLKRFGFFDERIDPAGRLVGGPSKLIPSGASYPVERRETASPVSNTRGVTWALGAAIALLVALIALVAYPRFMAEPTGALEIAAAQPGTSIEVDGSGRGVTGDGPLLVEDLELGRSYKVTATKDGWQSATQYIRPEDGRVTQVSFDLRPMAIKARIESDPPGAEVRFEGEVLGTTPFNVESLPASQQVELVFSRTGYVPGTRTVQLPGPGGQLTISHALALDPRWGSVSITSEPSGATVYHNDTVQADKTPISEHLVATGQRQHFTIKAPGYKPAHVYVNVKSGQRAVPVHATLAKGGSLTVTAPDLPQGEVTVRGVRACTRKAVPLRDCPLDNGTYKIEVVSSRPYARIKETITIRGNEVHRPIAVGVVAAADGHKLVVRGYKTGKAAFTEGSHSVGVMNVESGETREMNVRIAPGRTITLP